MSIKMGLGPCAAILCLWFFADPANAQSEDCGSQVLVDEQNSQIRVRPNGSDDTANLQCALNIAIARNIPKVRLTSGEFFVSSITAERFVGSLDGGSIARTRITVLDDSIDCAGIHESGITPAAIRFISGEPRIRFLAIGLSSPCIGEIEPTSRLFFAAVHFTGQNPEAGTCRDDVVFAVVDRVRIEQVGERQEQTIGVSADPVRLVSCNRLLGSMKLNRNIIDGVTVAARVTMRGGAQIDVKNNAFSGNQTALVLEDSNIEASISFNRFTPQAGGAAIYSAIYQDPSVVETRVVVYRNRFELGNSSSGIRFEADIAYQEASVNIAENEFVMTDSGMALYVIDASNGALLDNQFSGTASSALVFEDLLSDVQDWVIKGNDLTDLEVERNHLDLWFGTFGFIVGPDQGIRSVRNLGFGHIFIDPES